jgi:hypothetical protein
MKKVLMLVAIVFGTSVMVNAQATPAQTTPVKEMKATKKAKTAKTEKKADAMKVEAPKAKK